MLRGDHIGSLKQKWQIKTEGNPPDRPQRLYRIEGDHWHDFGSHDDIGRAQDAAIAIEVYEREHPPDRVAAPPSIINVDLCP
jgi:hypothetical protein